MRATKRDIRRLVRSEARGAASYEVCRSMSGEERARGGFEGEVIAELHALEATGRLHAFWAQLPEGTWRRRYGR